MADIILRGLAKQTHSKIQRMARSENLSMNQMVARLLLKAIAVTEKEREKEKERTDVFRRIDELRERMYHKYGLFEDSAKLIREDRDSR